MCLCALVCLRLAFRIALLARQSRGVCLLHSHSIYWNGFRGVNSRPHITLYEYVPSAPGEVHCRTIVHFHAFLPAAAASASSSPPLSYRTCVPLCRGHTEFPVCYFRISPPTYLRNIVIFFIAHSDETSVGRKRFSHCGTIRFYQKRYKLMKNHIYTGINQINRILRAKKCNISDNCKTQLNIEVNNIEPTMNFLAVL